MADQQKAESQNAKIAEYQRIGGLLETLTKKSRTSSFSSLLKTHSSSRSMSKLPTTKNSRLSSKPTIPAWRP